MKFLSFLWTGLLLSLTACEFSVSTANLQDLMICDQLSTDDRCASNISNFGPDAPAFVASCDLKNAPDGTSVCFYWYFLGEQTQLIDSVNYVSQSGGTLHLHSNLNAPNSGWPIGSYEVVVRVLTDNGNELRKQFQVVSPSSSSFGKGIAPGFGEAIPTQAMTQDEAVVLMDQPGLTALQLCKQGPDLPCEETSLFSSRTPQFFAKAHVEGKLEGETLVFCWYGYDSSGKQIRVQRDEWKLHASQSQDAFSELILDKPEWGEKELWETEAKIIASPLPPMYRFFYVSLEPLTQKEIDFLEMAASVRGFFDWYEQNHVYLSRIDLVRYPESDADLNDKGGLHPEGVDQLLETLASCPYLASTFTQIEADYLRKLEQIWQHSGSLSNQEEIPYGLDHDRILASQEMEKTLRAALTSEIQLKQHLGNQAYVNVAGIPIRMLRQADQWLIDSFEYAWQA
ncbi:MAG: hypothetical protein AAF587_04730 [Bacteroidota bacterium]